MVILDEWQCALLIFWREYCLLQYFLMYFVAVGFLMLTWEILWWLMCVSNVTVKHSLMNCTEALIINEPPGNTCHIWELSVTCPIKKAFSYQLPATEGMTISPIKQIWAKLWNKVEKPISPWKELTFWRNILTMCQRKCAAAKGWQSKR